MHINMYIYIYGVFSKFAQVGAVHMQFQYLQQFQYAHLISTCFRFSRLLLSGVSRWSPAQMALGWPLKMPSLTRPKPERSRRNAGTPRGWPKAGRLGTMEVWNH